MPVSSEASWTVENFSRIQELLGLYYLQKYIRYCSFSYNKIFLFVCCPFHIFPFCPFYKDTCFSTKDMLT